MRTLPLLLLALLAPAAPGPNDPGEPRRERFSLEAAVEFLDAVAVEWQSTRKCFACHTDHAYLQARPLVSWKTPVHAQVRAKLEELAEHPRQSKYAPTEAVLTAAVLAQNDAITTRALHPLTRKALDRMWTLQREDGGFDWMKYNQPPSEFDDHYGVTVAAIGAGSAPGRYAESPAAQAGLERIRKYLRANPPTNLHQRAMVLLASLDLPGFMTAEERARTVRDFAALQKPDGGWGLATFAPWERSDGKRQDLASSDGYGTGFAVYVMRRAGVPASDPRIRSGIAWLKSNQRESGRWFTRSLWKDQKHYLTHHGTSWAILALTACGER